MKWLGIEQEIERRAQPRRWHAFEAGNTRLATLDMATVDSPYKTIYDIAQPEVERCLEAACAATEMVELRRSAEVTGIRNEATCASVEYQMPASGPSTFSAPLAVACDGYHSPARGWLGLHTEKKDYGAHSIVADFRVSQRLEVGMSRIVLNPERPYGYFPFAADRFRLVLRVNRGESSEEVLKPDFLRKKVYDLLGEFDGLKLVWASMFRLSQRQSETYHQGRWILAGDAAHAMGPSAGSGMQLGLLGVWRLAWRIHLSLDHPDRTPDLLSDYSREHRQTAEAVQAENALIFRNLAIRSKVLGGARNALLWLAGHLSPFPRILATTVALESSNLRTTPACDSINSPGAHSLASFGDWKRGHKAPTSIARQLPTSLEIAGQKHLLIPLSAQALRHRSEAERLAGWLQPTWLDLSANQDGPPIFALMRPDQTVVGIYRL